MTKIRISKELVGKSVKKKNLSQLEDDQIKMMRAWTRINRSMKANQDQIRNNLLKKRK